MELCDDPLLLYMRPCYLYEATVEKSNELYGYLFVLLQRYRLEQRKGTIMVRAKVAN